VFLLGSRTLRGERQPPLPSHKVPAAGKAPVVAVGRAGVEGGGWPRAKFPPLRLFFGKLRTTLSHKAPLYSYSVSLQSRRRSQVGLPCTFVEIEAHYLEKVADVLPLRPQILPHHYPSLFWTKGSPPSSHKQIIKEITTAGCCVRDQRVSRVISRALIRPMNFPKVV
jgi:hypothetical protein